MLLSLQLKLVGAFALVGSLVSGCGSGFDPMPNTTVSHTPITVRVSEGGASEYTLTDAYVESALYDARINRLSINGKLASGKLITLDFNRLQTSTLPVYATDQFAATLNGVAGTSMSGTSFYSPQTKTVDGTFSASFPSTGVLTGTFAGVQTQ